MPDPDFHIRPMSLPELEFAIDLAAHEGWNPGLDDAGAFFAADPEGFLVGMLGDTPVGCISAVRYGQEFGFIGFYIVLPEYRESRYGMLLARAGLRRLQGITTGIDGVFERQDNYSKLGFSLAYRNIRYEWQGRQQPPDPPAALVRVTATDDIEHYDRLCFPAPRHAFLDAWLRMPDSAAYAWRDNGTIRGYGVIRRCREGWKIGPLFADTRPVAETLLLGLSHETAADEPIYLDVPEINFEAMQLAADYGMKEVFGTARMYKGHTPDIDVNRIYGVTSFELG